MKQHKIFFFRSVLRCFLLSVNNNYTKNNYTDNNQINLIITVSPAGGRSELHFAERPWCLAVVTCSDPVVGRTRCSVSRIIPSCSHTVRIDLVLVLVWCWCVTSCRLSALYLDSLMTQRRTGETDQCPDHY